jgi:ubiquinone/menaquinone biosynthesis C-methylase UbiE
MQDAKRKTHNEADPFCVLHFALRAQRYAVHWGFERLYRECAWAYDAVAAAVSRGLWRRWALTALPFIRGRVLELGFGPGHVQLALASDSHAAWGLDASPQMISIAHHRLRRAGYPARLAQGRAQQIPFAPATFDTVLATFPAEYIADPRTHAEIRRVLAPGGRVVILPLAQLDRSFYTRLVNLAYWLTLHAPAPQAGPQAGPQTTELRIGDISLETHWVRVGPSQALVLVGDLGNE